MAKDFLVSTEPEIKLSGSEKVAILLSELGMAISDDILGRVVLTDKEKKALNKAYKKFGKYNPHNRYEARREVQVLQEVMNYGKFKNILPAPKPDFYHQKQQEVLSLVQESPDTVVNLLKGWLGDE